MPACHRSLLALGALLAAGCSRLANDAPAPARPPPLVAASAPYPVGARCARPDALASEKRSLPPEADWRPVSSATQRLSVRVPDGVFTVTDGADGLVLVGADKAETLGDEGRERHFRITLRRFARSIDDLLGDRRERAPLHGVYVDEAFPKRNVASFAPRLDEPIGPGAAARIAVGGRPAYVWITGAEGYDTDYVLVDLGKDDTALVVAEWSSSIMRGQPECWQREVIGGVVESLTAGSRR
jgi:hypothetical protein